MRRLLDKEYEKRLKAMHFLYINNNPLKINELGKLIKNDSRTTLLILREIQEDIHLNDWEHMIFFDEHALKAGVIDCTFSGQFSLSIFLAYYMKKSFCFEFCMTIFNNQYESLQVFSDSHFISIPTIYRKIKPLKMILKEFHLNLDLSSPNLINGEEHHIRYFYFVLFWEIFHSSNIFFKEANKMRSFISTISKKYTQFSPASLFKLEIMLAIVITRTKQSFFLDPSFPLEIYSDTLEMFKEGISSFFYYFELPSDADIENEATFLYAFISLTETYSQEHFEGLSLSFFKFPEASFSVADKWISIFSSFFSINLSNQDYLYLLINLMSIHSRKKFFPDEKSVIGAASYQEVLHRTHPHILKKALLFFKQIEKQINITLDEYLLFSYAVLIGDLVKSSGPTLNICVFSSINEEQQATLIRSIKQCCFIPIHFDSTISASTDLVISDFPIDYSFFDYQSEIHFQWNAFPTIKEWDALIKKIKDLYYKAFDQTISLSYTEE